MRVDKKREMDAIVYWLAADQKEIHFIDSVISAYDGLATVRRDYRVRDGRTMYKAFVAPGMEEEFLEVIERLRRHANLGPLEREEPDDVS